MNKRLIMGLSLFIIGIITGITLERTDFLFLGIIGEIILLLNNKTITINYKGKEIYNSG